VAGQGAATCGEEVTAGAAAFKKQVVIRDGRLAVDRLADAHIPVLYLLAGEDLAAPPKSFVEKPQLGAIVDNTREADSKINSGWRAGPCSISS